jgi:hypothetical protein
MLAAESDDLWVRRMIACFQSKHHLRIGGLEIMLQRRLFHTRAQDQNLPARRNRLCDLLQEVRIAVSAFPKDAVRPFKPSSPPKPAAWIWICPSAARSSKRTVK